MQNQSSISSSSSSSSSSSTSPTSSTKEVITLLHLDLGIGGAEQLMVSLALQLQRKGYIVRILTTHHDKNHCFEETKPDGPLGPFIEVYGDWIPVTIFGKGTALLGAIRMIYLALILIFFAPFSSFVKRFPSTSSNHRGNLIDSNIVLLDGVSAPISFLKPAGFKLIFYCHFPDKLLVQNQGGKLKKIYRLFVDKIEQLTLSRCDLLFVNSNFTRQILSSTYPDVVKKIIPNILYPGVDTSKLEQQQQQHNNNNKENMNIISSNLPLYLQYINNKNYFISLNRYERKKKISLALYSYYKYLQLCNTSYQNNTILIIAGGYDKRVNENVEYLNELIKITTNLKLKYIVLFNDHINDNSILKDINDVQVIFRMSISNQERNYLLNNCKALLYTPSGEHFGIVPCEAMLSGAPVVAVNDGGPVETVKDGETGFLCEQTDESFADALLKLTHEKVNGKYLYELMKEAGPKRVKQYFSQDAMGETLCKYIEEIKKK